ncbi:MAG: thiamine pyrophosphate-dependent dehydrogenase E1 component subunit alpha, partial [Planctomycetota bacterium]|nr:thiamine pyrophosphate-dependent dehydrogenase E1 component subunit alpha [Planctomycetota bacterium]
LKLMMAELCGKKTGYCRGRGGSMHIADVAAGNLGATGVVGGHIPVATGAAVACKLKGEGRAVLCFFGDGASNNGAFHESLNLAGAWKLPVVYVCENNMYGMSVPWAKAAAVKDVAKRAEAYGFEGMVVDGQLPLDVRRAVLVAMEKARNGGGPTLVEAKTYRYRGHSRSDARKYRTKEEEEYWRARCPILLFRKLLDGNGIFSQAESDRLNEEVVREIDEAEKFALQESPYPDPSELFEDVYVHWIEGEKGLVRRT